VGNFNAEETAGFAGLDVANRLQNPGADIAAGIARENFLASLLHDPTRAHRKGNQTAGHLTSMPHVSAFASRRLGDKITGLRDGRTIRTSRRISTRA
jgi:hypothetical protein